ncbi:MAG: DUF1549 domain-containing protein, partial [Planctomycetaceae bacterium]|nr:DUF1549 domain-containing protein [Planctomycetaceae bacterium]
MNPTSVKLLELTSLYCEQQLNEEQSTELQQLLKSDPVLLELFVSYVQLHGQLSWDSGVCGLRAAALCRMDKIVEDEDHADVVADSARRSALKASTSASDRVGNSSAAGSRLRTLVGLACVAAILLMMVSRLMSPSQQDGPNLVNQEPLSTGDVATVDSAAGTSIGPGSAEIPPLPLVGLNQRGNRRTAPDSEQEPRPSEPTGPVLDLSDDAAVIAALNDRLRAGWQENNVQPVATADDSEWVRRAYLTFTGRIPTAAEVRTFLNDSSARKRPVLVDALNQDLRTAENLAVIWTNLLIGRSNPREVNEDAMFVFLEEQFADNQPWLKTVGQLITASGRSDENGAANFLLAHLNNEATPATAVTARLFLGEQVQCTQCHDHPFARDVKQTQFWALNAFFKQVKRQPVLLDTRPMLVSMQDGRRRRVWELTDSNDGGMTFYETRRGQQVAVLPEYAGVVIPEDSPRNRREELWHLLETDPDQKVAR